MQILVRIYGWPHEMLHVLALWLIGRRALRVTPTHVDIPDDLSTGEYVFVAGLPALVFWSAAGLCLRALLGASHILAALVLLGITLLFTLAAVGTLGDIILILARLITALLPSPPDDEG